MALSRRDLIVGTAVGAGLVVVGERSNLFSSSPSSPPSTSTTVPPAPGTSQTSLDPEPVGLGPDEFNKVILAELDKFERLARAANLPKQ